MKKMKKGKKGKRLDKPVLAEGEVTGHMHMIQSDVDVYEMEDGTREFSLDRSSKLTHEEHAAIVIPTGDYVSGIVQEFDYFEQAARKVKD